MYKILFYTFYSLVFLLTNFTDTVSAPIVYKNYGDRKYKFFLPGSSKIYKDSVISSGFSITTEFQYLNSTHITPFLGTSFIAAYNIPSFSIGVGGEYTHATFHNDNTWKLYNLKFIPVFFDFKYLIKVNKIVTPYLQFSPGITFMQYEKEQPSMAKPYLVEEKGIYVFAGFGFLVNVHSRWKPSASVGFKGFNMSTSVLDVNPHGFTMKAGLNIYFR